MWRWSRKELAAGVTPLGVGVLLAAFAAATCLVALAGDVGLSHAEPSCSQPSPIGSTERAAERVVNLFVQACYPDAVGAWYQLAPRIRNAAGLWEYAGFLYLEARDRPPAAFEFLLELHGDRWLMASFVLVDGNAIPSYPT